MLVRDEGLAREELGGIVEQVRGAVYGELHWRFSCLAKAFRAVLREREMPKMKSMWGNI